MAGFVTLSRPRPVFNARPAIPIVPFERVGRLPPQPKPLPTVDELLAKFSLVCSTGVPDRLTLADIANAVAIAFGSSAKDIRGSGRELSRMLPRLAFYFLARDLTPRSSTEIGRFCGGRDHTTVLNGVERCKARMESDADFCRKVMVLRATLGARA